MRRSIGVQMYGRPIFVAMCGIVGIIDTSSSLDELARIGAAMLEVTSHRGPDYRGTWSAPSVFLGHNRLSIIDLSSASNQPMTRAEHTLTYNGEIYNYIELRDELRSYGYTFSTTGDVEVILAAYDKWGTDCVRHFIGMWAFAIWDGGKRQLFCSRDRFGIKPFHYAEREGRLYFCSEIKGVKRSPLFRGGVNEAQVARGLYLGFMQHHTETYFNDIHILPAAHNMLWSDGAVRVWQYYDIETAAQDNASFGVHTDEFRALFLDSIKLTARRDVPLGVCLSGGLDSTSIACALANLGSEHEIRTFTAYYTGKGEVDERPFIDHVLQRYPQIEPHYISPSDTDVAQAIQRIAWLMDAPMPSSSYVSHYFVMQLAGQHGIKVALDGQGSDEIMGGYMHSMYRVLADEVRGGHIGTAFADLMAHRSRQSYSIPKTLSIAAKALLTAVRDEPSLYAMEFARTYPWLMRQAASEYPINIGMKSGTRLNAFLHNLIYVTLLPTLLHTEDINAMAFSIESRVPFLDHRLVQLCFSMPNDHKVDRGVTKKVLRAAMRGMVPDPVLDRRDKTGFTTPGHVVWLRGALSHLIDGDWSELDGFVDRAALRSVLARYRSGDNSEALFVWRLAMLRLWMQIHVMA